MRTDELARWRCPATGQPLELTGAVLEGDTVVSGALRAPGVSYPIERGVPNFVTGTLTPVEAETQAEYDRVADAIYDAAVDWQFKAFLEDEDAIRESMIDQLDLRPDADVLEVGCGTGRDSFRLARRLGANGRLHMQDLSAGMVHACVRRLSAMGDVTPRLEYSASSATALPFTDNTFDAVFHFGGFNTFGDLRRAAAELMRVARPGARIVFGDEAVGPWLRDTEFYEIVATNNPLFREDVPLSVLPPGARDVSVRWVIANCFYVISFRKGDGPPPLDLDLPHKGWRGGTMRSRYFGRLEGVTLEAKAMAIESAKTAGKSVHQWLDDVIRDAAKDPE